MCYFVCSYWLYLHIHFYYNLMMKKITSFIFFIGLLSCKISPKEINYGKDHCAHCDMTVVDKTHAASYTTKKGRSYPFDAIECLVMKINKDQNEDKMAFILVADYDNPGVLINASEATYLISEGIKSPMGANLSAFSSIETAKKAQSMHSGSLYSWKQLKAKLSK